MTSDQAWEPCLRPTAFPNKDSSSKKHNFLPMEGSPFWKWVFTSWVWAALCLGIREVLGFPVAQMVKKLSAMRETWV